MRLTETKLERFDAFFISGQPKTPPILSRSTLRYKADGSGN